VLPERHWCSKAACQLSGARGRKVVAGRRNLGSELIAAGTGSQRCSQPMGAGLKLQSCVMSAPKTACKHRQSIALRKLPIHCPPHTPRQPPARRPHPPCSPARPPAGAPSVLPASRPSARPSAGDSQHPPQARSSTRPARPRASSSPAETLPAPRRRSRWLQRPARATSRCLA
jgi:hypothetical protein